MKFHPKLFLPEALLFGATLCVGLLAAIRYAGREVVEPLLEPSSISPAHIIGFIAAVVLIWVLTRVSQRLTGWIFWAILSLIVLAGTQMTFGSFLSPDNTIYASLLFLCTFIVVRNVLMHDLAMIIAIGGIGAVLGVMITPMMAIVVFIVLSFYDIIAVYATRHMVHMAEGMVRSGAIFGFIIPSRLKLFLSSRREAQARIGNDFMILGSGDIALPVIFVSSLVRQSVPQAIIVAVFSMLGLLLTHMLFMNQSKRQAMAALPPIATMTILGYVISLLLNY